MFPTLIRFARLRALASASAVLVLLTLVALLPLPRVGAQTPTPEDSKVSVFGEGAHRLPGDQNLRAPVAVTTARPDYTREAMRERIEGKVGLELVIGIDGSVTDARIVESLDPEHGLDEAALRAAKKWTFKPATLDGEAVPVIVGMEMGFRLP